MPQNGSRTIVCAVWVPIILDGNWPGANYPGWQLSCNPQNKTCLISEKGERGRVYFCVFCIAYLGADSIKTHTFSVTFSPLFKCWDHKKGHETHKHEMGVRKLLHSLNNIPSRHTTLEQRCYNVVLVFWRRYNVVLTSCACWTHDAISYEKFVRMVIIISYAFNRFMKATGGNTKKSTPPVKITSIIWLEHSSDNSTFPKIT